MIFIAESGSTKCDAVFLDNDGKEVCRFRTMGFNPYFHDSDFIEHRIGNVPEIKKYASQTTHVFFYGAGCSSPALNTIIQTGLQPIFSKAKIQVDHDLKACAFATYTGKPAISCILGTGSNSVYFDGENIREEVPALAFILGDEGSASYIGKKLIAGYFYKTMPLEFRDDFFKTYGLDKNAVVERVYTKPHANVFLASLAPFASKHIKHSFFRDLITEGFTDFLKTHVQCFPESKNVPVHFVGSIAHYFKPILSSSMKQLGLLEGNLIQKPLDGLINYHVNHLKETVELFKN